MPEIWSIDSTRAPHFFTRSRSSCESVACCRWVLLCISEVVLRGRGWRCSPCIWAGIGDIQTSQTQPNQPQPTETNPPTHLAVGRLVVRQRHRPQLLHYPAGPAPTITTAVRPLLCLCWWCWCWWLLLPTILLAAVIGALGDDGAGVPHVGNVPIMFMWGDGEWGSVCVRREGGREGGVGSSSVAEGLLPHNTHIYILYIFKLSWEKNGARRCLHGVPEEEDGDGGGAAERVVDARVLVHLWW